MGKYLDIARQANTRQPTADRPERQRAVALAWPCPHCGRPATIEAVEPSLDRQRMLTFWHCEPCQSYAVTPDTIRHPPKGWGTKAMQ